MLVLSRYIAEHELAPLSRYITLEDVLIGARKVVKGLGIEIKAPIKGGFRFFKVRVAQKDAGRMVVFVVISTQKVVPVLIRLQKDKVFGMNMAMNNPAVVEEVRKNMGHLLDDIEHGTIEEFAL